MKTAIPLSVSASALPLRLCPVAPLRRSAIRRFAVGHALPIFLSTFVTLVASSAATPNPKLVALVPPAAQMVAGISAPPRAGLPSNFVLITRYNKVDLNDFIALWGVDSSRAIEQIIMVASERDGIALAEHSLMASGYFDQALIYRSAYAAGAKPVNYRGIRLLEIQPLHRERGNYRDVRWLAMIDSKLALFGTIIIIRQELDRYLAHTVAEASLVQKLAHLRRDDITWCITTLADRDGELQALFQRLDSRLANLLRAGDTIQFGIHYGRQVVFDYEVGMASDRGLETVQMFLKQPSTEQTRPSILPVAEWTRTDKGVRGVLKIPKDRYETWLASVGNSEMRAAADAASR